MKEYLCAYPFSNLKSKLEGLTFEYDCREVLEGSTYKLVVSGLDEDYLRFAYNWVYDRDIDEIPVVRKLDLDDEMSYDKVLSDMNDLAEHRDGCLVRLV